MEGAAGVGGRVMLRWQLLPGQLLSYRSWQDEYVLFNNLSGDTHLLGEAAIALLLDLRDGAIDADEIAGDDHAATRALLAQLAGLGLVESLPC